MRHLDHHDTPAGDDLELLGSWDRRLLADIARIGEQQDRRRRLAVLAALFVAAGLLLCAATVVYAANAGASYSCSLAPTGPMTGGTVTVRYSPPDGRVRTLWDSSGPHTMQPGETVTVSPIDGEYVLYPTSSPADRTDIRRLIAACLPAAPTTTSTTVLVPTTAPPVPPATTPPPASTTSTPPTAPAPPATEVTWTDPAPQPEATTTTAAPQPVTVCPAGSYLRVTFASIPQQGEVPAPAEAVLEVDGRQVVVSSIIPSWVAVFPFDHPTSVTVVAGDVTVGCWEYVPLSAVRTNASQLPITGARSRAFGFAGAALLVVGASCIGASIVLARGRRVR